MVQHLNINFPISLNANYVVCILTLTGLIKKLLNTKIDYSEWCSVSALPFFWLWGDFITKAPSFCFVFKWPSFWSGHTQAVTGLLKT